MHDGLTILIPVYNSAAILPVLAERLDMVRPGLAKEVEVLFINDSSPDGSWAVIRELSARYSWIRGINLMRNFGQHNALLCGLRSARYPITISMDDDLQHPPEEIPRLLEALTQDLDVVYGTPETERHGLWRDLASRITKVALRASMGVETASQVSALRVFRTRLREAFAEYSGPTVNIDVLLTWGTTRFTSIRVRHDPRFEGKSGYTLRHLVVHALNMVTGFSTLPLQVASLVGFAFTLFGLLVLAYVVGRVLIQGSVVPGFAFLASTIAIFSGVQLFALGIIGEYLARMHFRMMARPSYAVREQTGEGEEQR